MNNTNISAQSEQFYIDCEVIETKYEYPQYTGVEKWIIITDLTEEELKGKYAEQIAPLKPFIVLPRSFGEVRDDYRRNEKKHLMRAVRSIEPFDYDDDLLMAHHPELIDDDRKPLQDGGITDETMLNYLINNPEFLQKFKALLGV